MGNLFDVHVPTLDAGSGWLRTDAGDVHTAGSEATGGVHAAAGACGGGPLTGALGRLATRLSTQTDDLRTAVTGAGDTMASNALTYALDDSAASTGLGAVDWSVGGAGDW